MSGCTLRKKKRVCLVRQSDRAEKDVQQIGVIKDRDENVLKSEDSVLRRVKECIEVLMNEENERTGRVQEVETTEQEVGKSSKDFLGVSAAGNWTSCSSLKMFHLSSKMFLQL